MNELVTCITPTYNRSKLLKEAIESTIAQTYQNWELIIVDDGSTDDTEEVVNQYIKKDNRIKYFKNPQKGGSAARNYGVNIAKGEYIAFLDDDDVSLPHRFESQLNAMKKSGSRFIVSGYRVMSRLSNKVIGETKVELKGKGAGFPSRWMVKKELLDNVGGFDEEFPSMQEIELSYRIAEHETYALHGDIVTILYKTNNSVSRRKNDAPIGKLLLLEKYKNKMHPIEAASWYYSVAMSYYAINDNKNAYDYFKLAADYDTRELYKYALYYYNIMNKYGGMIRIINKKILSFIHKYKFPMLIKHKIIC